MGNLIKLFGCLFHWVSLSANGIDKSAITNMASDKLKASLPAEVSQSNIDIEKLSK